MDRAGHMAVQGEAALTKGGAWLKAGKILAVKGVGGFHLTCDARNATAIAELRHRKGRPAKPLAVMARDLKTAAAICQVTDVEAQLLLSPSAPIVLLSIRPEAGLPSSLAPGLNAVGIMLPYTQLYRQLLAAGLDVIVCTSGNKSGLPTAKDDQQALAELGQIADYFLLHDTPIKRCDDTVIFVVAGQPRFIRRSRGYYTDTITVPVTAEKPVLAVGADLKNTFCLLVDNRAYLSQHMGDIATKESEQNLVENIVALCHELAVTPTVVTADLHPAFSTSRLASQLAAMFDAVRHPGVQHHQAHLAACLGENGLMAEAIGILLDGTGYGTGGQLWGFEVASGDYAHYERHYRLAEVPLPGGDNSVRHPFITATAYLSLFLGQRGRQLALELFPQYKHEVLAAEQIMAAGINCPLSSSCGRLFDAVAAMLHLCYHNTYEGQAPAELSSLVPWFLSNGPSLAVKPPAPYPYTINRAEINPAPLLEAIMADLMSGISAENIAWRFHETMVAIIKEAATMVRSETGLNRVVLSGGSWYNRYLLGRTMEALAQDGFQVYSHHLVPAGDGGLALGQALVALCASPIMKK